MKFEKMNHDEKRYAEIITSVKKKMVTGELQPGDKLPTETELCAQLGVSRTPVREAVKILEAIGVIEIRRGEGMFIRNETSASNLNPLIFSLIMHGNTHDKLVEFRQHFEVMVIDLASKNSSLEDLNHITEIFHSQVQQIQTIDHLSYEEVAEIDLIFHYELLKLTNNPYVIEIGETIYELSKHKIKYIVESLGYKYVEQSLKTHRMYLEMLLDRSQHNEDGINRLKQQIASNWNTEQQ